MRRKPSVAPSDPLLTELNAQCSDFRNRIQALEKEQEAVEYKILLRVKELIGAGEEDDIVLGDWDCPTSPTGLCIYETLDDPMCDCCLYCNEPDERK